MRRPTISFLIPTANEERPLERSIASIAPQLKGQQSRLRRFLGLFLRGDNPLLSLIFQEYFRGDEVVIIGDTLDGPLPGVQKICAKFRSKGFNVRYFECNTGHHCWGHCQLNWGFNKVKNDLIHINDDDDVWSPGAAANIRWAALRYRGHPLLFRFKAHFGMVLWEMQGRMVRDHIGGHCLVQPNIKGKVGKMTCEYSGDFDLIDSCLKAYGGYSSAVWIDKIIAVARPS